MEFVLNNPFTTLYGPYFLALYAVFIIIVAITLLISKRLIDTSGKYPIPNISNNVDPFEISYLRGKDGELARSLIFSLMQKDYLEFSESKTSVKRIKNNKRTESLSKIELATLEWLGEERTTREIFSSTGLVKQLESYSRVYKHKLENERLLINEDTLQLFSKIKLLAIIAVIGFGAYKLVAAIANGKTNIIFIVILGFFGFKLVSYFASLPRVSKLGQTYLNRLQLTFENLKLHTQNLCAKNANINQAKPVTLAGIDPILLSVGVFGGGILAGTVYDQYNQAFAKTFKQNSENYSSCGSDCGSCSSSCSSGSSCSSSSCSSCSSCGGGCGGCGGCS